MISNIKYFDRITYEIITYANLKIGYYETPVIHERIAELMIYGVIKKNDYKRNKLRFTIFGKKYYEEFINKLHNIHNHNLNHRYVNECKEMFCTKCEYKFNPNIISEFDIPKCQKEETK